MNEVIRCRGRGRSGRDRAAQSLLGVSGGIYKI